MGKALARAATNPLRDQLQQMHYNTVHLVVPQPYHTGYPAVAGAHIWSVDDFVKILQARYAG